MWKTILAGAAVIAIASTSFVYAQQRGNAAERGHAAARPVNRGLSQEDRAAFTDARIAALKAGLRLTPDQETNWPAFETALRDIANAHAEHRAEPRQSEPRPNDPVAKLRRHAEMMTNAGASLTRLADAQEPLYQSLDDSQKRRFHLLSRILSGHQAHFAQERGPGWHQMHERHHGGDDRSPGPRGMRGQDRGGSDSDGMAEQL